MRKIYSIYYIIYMETVVIEFFGMNLYFFEYGEMFVKNRR